VIEEAKAALAAGATRYCMSAAWRSPRARDMGPVVEMVNPSEDKDQQLLQRLGIERTMAGIGGDFVCNSLIPFKNSLILNIFSLIICIGNCSRSGCRAAVSWY